MTAVTWVARLFGVCAVIAVAIPAAAGPARAVARGAFFVCAMTTGGTVSCWGDNTAGQLGDGTTSSRAAPRPVTGLSGVTAIAAGGSHACAITSGGGLVCWGEGYGTVPTPVAGLSTGVIAVAAGSRHTCAVTSEGGVLCWGDNRFGQLGDGTVDYRSTPTAVSGLSSGVTAVTVGYYHTCAVTSSGSVLCWGGCKDDGRLPHCPSQLWGHGWEIPMNVTPTEVDGLASGVTSIAAGSYHTCALSADGAVACWGENYDGQLGDGTRTSRLTAAPVNELTSGVTAVAAGENRSCALTSAGGVACWGPTAGDGSAAVRLSPVPVSGLSAGVVGLSMNLDSYALTSGGSLRRWGSADAPSPVAAPAVAADFDEDWQADLLWRNTATGENIIWHMIGAGYSSYARVLGVTDTNWRTVHVADFDGDRRPDVFWRNIATGENAVWYMNGDAYARYARVSPVPAEWDLGGVGDFDSDGEADLFWRNSITGENVIWFMNGAAYKGSARVTTVADTNWTVVAVPDFDADGYPDIYWHNRATGENIVWFMRGAGYFSYGRIDTVSDLTWTPVTAADFNNDGVPDIVWRNSATGGNIIWYIRRPTVDPRGRGLPIFHTFEWVLGVADPNWTIGYQR